MRHAALALLICCSGSVDDPPNGAPTMTEAEACDALMWSYQSRGLDLGCYTTVHTCPNHIRIPHGGAACMSYDAASVVECVHLWGAAATCVRLVAAADCTAVPVDGDGC